MRAYVINLDAATDRWASLERSFSTTSLTLHRIAGIDGRALRFPCQDYSEARFRWLHGRPTSLGHVGCYLSHVRAMRAFLATDDTHALIGEDDVILGPDFESILNAALRYSRHWNVLRLTGLSRGVPLGVARLTGDHFLCVSLGRLKGTGAYIVDRKAAHAFIKHLLPMWLPIDHAMDREWFFGICAAYVLPFPASQTQSGFRSSIHTGKAQKLSVLRRCLATYPYQVFNEVSRWLFRTSCYLKTKIALAGRASSSLPILALMFPPFTF